MLVTTRREKKKKVRAETNIPWSARVEESTIQTVYLVLGFSPRPFYNYGRPDHYCYGEKKKLKTELSHTQI